MAQRNGKKMGGNGDIEEGGGGGQGGTPKLLSYTARNAEQVRIQYKSRRDIQAQRETRNHIFRLVGLYCFW